MKVLIESTVNFSKIPFTVIYKATYTSRRLDNAYSSTIVWMEERYKLVLFSVAFFPISILKLKCRMVLIFLQTLRISLSATSIHVHYCIECVEIFYSPLKKFSLKMVRINLTVSKNFLTRFKRLFFQNPLYFHTS